MADPASPAADGHAGQAWSRELGRWLQLGHKRVLIMVRAADRTGLRSLARMLKAVDPDVAMMSRAADLRACKPNALVLLLLRGDDLDWLNINRPIIAQRSLRVVLWVDDEALRVRIKFECPDFHDWISHFVQCPAGVPEFAIEGLRVDEQLRDFVERVRESANADLGEKQSPYPWLTQIALALAGDPWRARDKLEDSLESGVPPVSGALSAFAAIRVLCGDYSQAIDLLADFGEGTPAQTHIYLALLRATGRAEEARTEHLRLLGTEPPTDHPPTHPETLAREYLLARLREF